MRRDDIPLGDTLPPLPPPSRWKRLRAWWRKNEDRIFWRVAVPAFIVLMIFLLSSCATPRGSVEVVQETVNLRPPCGSDRAGACHPHFPNRRALAEAWALECSGYVTAKAYMLTDAGYTADRLRIGITPDGKHAVLVVDGFMVLDNLRPGIGRVKDYPGLAVYPRVAW